MYCADCFTALVDGHYLGDCFGSHVFDGMMEG